MTHDPKAAEEQTLPAKPVLTAEELRLQQIKSRFAACCVAVKAMDAHRDDVTFDCPLCDGEGNLDSDTFDTVGGDQQYVGLQTFGVGKRLAATNEFVRHMAEDMAWLIERLDECALREAPASPAAVEGLIAKWREDGGCDQPSITDFNDGKRIAYHACADELEHLVASAVREAAPAVGGAWPAEDKFLPPRTEGQPKRITEGVADMLAIIDDPNSTEDERSAAASTIVEAVAPDILEDAIRYIANRVASAPAFTTNHTAAAKRVAEDQSSEASSTAAATLQATPPPKRSWQG